MNYSNKTLKHSFSFKKQRHNHLLIDDAVVAAAAAAAVPKQRQINVYKDYLNYQKLNKIDSILFIFMFINLTSFSHIKIILSLKIN